MIIHGREVKFLRSVEANCKILEISREQGKDVISEKLLGEDYINSQKTAAMLMEIMSEAAEKRSKYEDPAYIQNPMSADEALSLTDEEFSQAFHEMLNAYTGEKPTIELKEEADAKKNKHPGG